jgi:hypothetical protein
VRHLHLIYLFIYLIIYYLSTLSVAQNILCQMAVSLNNALEGREKRQSLSTSSHYTAIRLEGLRKITKTLI